MPTNAAAATPICQRRRSARRPMRSTASTTIASTAAFRPKNTAATAFTCCQATYSQDSAPITITPGSTNSEPAITPPAVRCSSQPM